MHTSKLGDTSYMRACHVSSAGINKPVQRHVSCALLCLRRGRCDLFDDAQFRLGRLHSIVHSFSPSVS